VLFSSGAGGERFDADGWLNTGDVGAMHRDGFLTLAGRDGEVINRGGEKVFPREVHPRMPHGAPGARRRLEREDQDGARRQQQREREHQDLARPHDPAQPPPHPPSRDHRPQRAVPAWAAAG